jgi:hypothetical protein
MQETKTMLVLFPGSSEPVEVKLKLGQQLRLPEGSRIVTKDPEMKWIDEILETLVSVKEKSEMEARLANMQFVAKEITRAMKRAYKHSMGEGDSPFQSVEESNQFKNKYAELLAYLSKANAQHRQGKTDEEIKAAMEADTNLLLNGLAAAIESGKKREADLLAAL